MRVFCDTNILLDVLLRRLPFYEESAAVWTLVEEGRIEGFISALSHANAHYVVRRYGGREQAAEAVRILLRVYTVIPLDRTILSGAVAAQQSDFEDAIQVQSAVTANAACLVTRNPTHFSTSPIRIFGPADFLSAHFPA